MRLVRLLAVVVLIAVPAFADLSAKYKEWGSSPQAYFMTKAERDQWSAVRTDADAEQFIKDFLAKRGPDFPALVNERVAAADKYLTYGKTPGSKTLRGKVIVLLGPPTSFNISDRTEKRAGEGTVKGTMAMAGDSGASLGDMTQAASRAAMEGTVYRTYDIGYTAGKTPKAYGKALNLAIELDTLRNTERVAGRGMNAELESALESAAAASVK